MVEHYSEKRVQELRKTRDSKRHSAHHSHGYPTIRSAEFSMIGRVRTVQAPMIDLA